MFYGGHELKTRNFFSFSELTLNINQYNPLWPGSRKILQHFMFNFRVFYTDEKSLIGEPLADVICYVT